MTSDRDAAPVRTRGCGSAPKTGVAAGDKPYAPACDRNREPILSVLHAVLGDRRHVLEIGSGTGQHAVHFAAAMPWLTWQCSDRPQALPGIARWLDDAGLRNTPAPRALDMTWPDWPERLRSALSTGDAIDAVFSANTLHIMAWPAVEAFFAGVGRVLADGPEAVLVVYGPFNRDGRYTSDSNRDFDGWLKARDSASGLRDFEAVDALAHAAGLRLVDDLAMPANNRCVVWRRASGET